MVILWYNNLATQVNMANFLRMYFILVKMHALFSHSLELVENLCRNKPSYAFFSA